MRISLINKLLILVLAVAFIYFIWGSFNKPRFTIDTSRTAVVKQMRELNRLETATFTIEKIIEAGTPQGNKLQEILYGDRILLIAHGQVIAGIDLSALPDDHIRISGKSISVTLPKPEILVTQLDNQQTRVYDRTRGILAPNDTNLESQARQAAESSIRQAACSAGILNQASDNARKQLTAFFNALGFTQVTLTIPQASCS